MDAASNSELHQLEQMTNRAGCQRPRMCVRPTQNCNTLGDPYSFGSSYLVCGVAGRLNWACLAWGVAGSRCRLPYMPIPAAFVFLLSWLAVSERINTLNQCEFDVWCRALKKSRCCVTTWRTGVSGWGGHVNTYGRFILMYGKNHHNTAVLTKGN